MDAFEIETELKEVQQKIWELQKNMNQLIDQVAQMLQSQTLVDRNNIKSILENAKINKEVNFFEPNFKSQCFDLKRDLKNSTKDSIGDGDEKYNKKTNEENVEIIDKLAKEMF